MELERVRQTLRDFAAQCAAIVRAVMDSEVGVNDKVGINTLSGSNAYKEVEGISTDDVEVVNLLINEYAVLYVDGNGFEWARRPVSVKKDQKWPPPQVIAEWCSRKGIPTDNRTVYLICRSIWEKGIKARPFVEASFEQLDNEFGDWADKLFNDLCSGLDEFFNE